VGQEASAVEKNKNSIFVFSFIFFQFAFCTQSDSGLNTAFVDVNEGLW